MPQRPNIINTRTAAVRGAGSGASTGSSHERTSIWGLVTVAPANATDKMFVAPTRLNAEANLEIPAGHWAPRGEVLPSVGDRCLMVFDNSGDVWVPQWDGAYELPKIAALEGKVTTLESEVTALESKLAVPVWHELSSLFTNSWVNTGGSAQKAQYTKDALGFVHCRGRIKSGTSGMQAFVLPEDYRIGAEDYFDLVESGVHVGAAVVFPTGAVDIYLAAGGTSSDIGLSAIYFYAEN